MQSAAAAGAATLCVAVLLLLLLAAVRHCVPDGKYVFGSVNVIPVFPFSSFKHDLNLMYPFAVLLYRSHLRPRFAYTTSSVITGMRGAKAGVSPPRRSLP